KRTVRTVGAMRLDVRDVEEDGCDRSARRDAMDRMKRIAAALCALAFFASASPAVDALFARGETLDYDLVWLKMTGGRARMTIMPQAADPANYRITSFAKSSSTFSHIYHVRDEIESVVTRANFTTVSYHKS